MRLAPWVGLRSLEPWACTLHLALVGHRACCPFASQPGPQRWCYCRGLRLLCACSFSGAQGGASPGKNPSPLLSPRCPVMETRGQWF